MFYEGLVGVLTEASKNLANRRRKHSNQPGWNDVADLHKDARECFAMWCNTFLMVNLGRVGYLT